MAFIYYHISRSFFFLPKPECGLFPHSVCVSPLTRWSLLSLLLLVHEYFLISEMVSVCVVHIVCIRNRVQPLTPTTFGGIQFIDINNFNDNKFMSPVRPDMFNWKINEQNNRISFFFLLLFMIKWANRNMKYEMQRNLFGWQKISFIHSFVSYSI